MHRPKLLVAAASLSMLCLTARRGEADPLDPSLERLTTPSTSDPLRTFLPDQAAFIRLVSEYGYAIAPTAMHTARTTGFGGFHFSLEGAFTRVNNDTDYWKKGTRGPQNADSKEYSVINKDPDPFLQLYSVKVRKGFPFGFELGGNLGYLGHSSILAGGMEASWSLLEGFRRGIPGIFPDFSVGAGVRTITGTPELSLTVASLDLQISKPLPLADSSVVTLYAGYQWLKIFADSGLLDATPNVDAIDACGFNGTDNRGQPICTKPAANGKPDFNNNFVFDKARIVRHRLILGLTYRYEIVYVGGQFMPEIVETSASNSGAEGDALAKVPRQWTLAFQAGVLF